jgi:hypothetical protein
VAPVTLPNFFLAGVPKAGTTSLYFYLRQHPQVYMSPIKEPTFFAAADLLADPYRQQFRRFLERDPTALRIFLEDTQANTAQHFILRRGDYLTLFHDVRHESAIGEASADYFWLPSAAAAIRAAVPAARLIFILRHPAERLFSWYLLALWRDPRLTFRAWFLAAKQPGAMWWPAVDGGRYVTHLQRFFALFPRDQMRIHLYDTFRADARAVLKDLFAFLGVDPGWPVDLSRRANETIVPRFRRLEWLRRRAAFSLRWLPEAARDVLRRAYRRVNDRPRGDFAMDPEDRRMVIDYYRNDLVGAGDLIGRDLSDWLR